MPWLAPHLQAAPGFPPVGSGRSLTQRFCLEEAGCGGRWQAVQSWSPGGITGVAVVQAGGQGHPEANWDPSMENLFQAETSGGLC